MGDDAVRHYEACLSLVQAADDRLGKDEAALLEALGHVQVNAQALDAGWQSVLAAVSVYRRNGDWAGMARAALVGVSALAPPTDLLELLNEVLAMPGTHDPRLEALLRAARTSLPLVAPAQRADDAARAREIAEVNGYEDVLGELAFSAGLRSYGSANLVVALAQFQEAVRHYEAARLMGKALIGGMTVGSVLLFSGRYGEAIQHAREQLLRLRSVRYPFVEQSHLFLTSEITCERGALEEAGALVAQMAPGSYMAPLMLIRIAIIRGEFDQLEQLLPDPSSAGGMTDLLCQVHGMRATALLAAGQVDRARVELDAFAAARDKPYVSGVLNDLDADDTLAALAGEELVRRVYGELQAADQVRVSPTGSADRIRGALALRLGLVDEAEAHYRTGLEWSERERCVLETGRTLQGLAEVAERRGDHATAMEHLDRAAAIFSNCGAKFYLDQVLAKKEILKA